MGFLCQMLELDVQVGGQMGKFACCFEAFVQNVCIHGRSSDFDKLPVFQLSHCERKVEHWKEVAGGTGVCNGRGMLYNPVARLFNSFTNIVSKGKYCLSMHILVTQALRFRTEF